MTDSAVYPGMALCAASPQLQCGRGVYERDGQVWASLYGRVEKNDDVIRVVGPRVVPFVVVGDEVLCKVTRVSQSQVFLDIFTVNGIACKDCCLRALLRREDVFDGDPSEVDLTLAFAGEELVKAKVVSVGDDYMRYSISIKYPGMGFVDIDQS